ncbi:hypothetical protein BDZ97DRAFT_1794343 [Flammula alnicola]|nr:hypothetical protein BDZ97DRAFT_1794343 [Flammula alnicola]
MHGTYQRRLPHAGRDFFFKRDSSEKFHTHAGVADEVALEDVNAAAGITGQITITILETIPVATSLSSTQWTTSTSMSLMTLLGLPTESATSISSTVTQDASTSTSTSSSQTSSSSSSSSFTPPPSVSPTTTPTPSPSVISNRPTSNAEESNSATRTTLSSGGVAGIVIGCLLFLFIAVFFLLRKRFMQNRQRLRGTWIRSRPFTVTPFPNTMPNDNEAYPTPTFAQVEGRPPSLSLAVRNTTSSLTPLPVSYNSPAAEASPIQSPGGGGAAFTAAIYSPGSAVPTTFAATVTSTFITSLPDELSITVGETMRVLAEYDDGWVLCMNMNGEQGMVPLPCLNRGPRRSTTLARPEVLSPFDMRGSLRVSSLD